MPRRFFSSEPQELEVHQKASDLASVPLINKISPKEEQTPTFWDLMPTVDRKKRDRVWDQKHPKRAYRGVDPTVHQAILELAISLNVTLDEIVRAFLESSLEAQQSGELVLDVRLVDGKFTLFTKDGWGREKSHWQRVSNQPRQSQENKLQKSPKKLANKSHHNSKMDQAWRTVSSYRIPDQLHLEIRTLATNCQLPTGTIVTRFLSFALDAYNQGNLILDLQDKPISRKIPSAISSWREKPDDHKNV